MPLYEYENQEHGISVVLRQPVDERSEEIVLRRKTVPSHVTVGVGARLPTAGEELLQDYKRLEDAGQFTDKPGYFTADEVKKAAQTPDAE